jgi:hypothetical protein
MAGPKNDQKRPNGECFGRDLPDKGCKTNVSDTYGVGDGDLCRGFTGGEKIGKDTKSDK